MKSHILIFALSILNCGLINGVLANGCSKENHQQCVALADPLLKDPHLIFPDNLRDIDIVCRSWSGFVDCIKRYIDRCFTKQRRDQFNAAVEAPIASVHQMCTVSTYQAEYLKHASCLKATVTDPVHCGAEYSALVEEVSKGDMARASLCCLHHHFRSCVITETRKRCDRGQIDGPASRFSRQILDRALNFLQDQCQHYIPNNGDCYNSVTENSASPAVSSFAETTSSRGSNRRPYHRTLSTDNYAGHASSFHAASTSAMNSPSYRSTGRSLSAQPKNYELDNRVMPTSLTMDITHHSTPEAATADGTTKTTDALTVTTNKDDDNNNNDNNNSSDNANDNASEEKKETTAPVAPSIEEPAVIVTQRSPSYGRGISWTTAVPKPTSEIPAWATSSYEASKDDIGTESWYPAAGSFGGNNIDEPNQQGLKKNGQPQLRFSTAVMSVVMIIFYII